MIQVLLIASGRVGDSAQEAGGHAGEHLDVMAVNWLSGVTSLVVFCIVLVILRLKVWPFITAGLDDRNQKILDEISAAEEARADADKAKADYESSLSDAREEAAAMIATARAEAQAAADALKKENEATVQDMKLRASKDIESARQSAVDSLHGEVTGLAASIASRILQREISVSDHEDLLTEALSGLESDEH